MTAKKLWMNGHTCLNCGKGWYNGYEPTRRLTAPCEECGHQAPDRMLPSEHKKAYKARDARLFANEPTS